VAVAVVDAERRSADAAVGPDVPDVTAIGLGCLAAEPDELGELEYGGSVGGSVAR